MGCRCRCVNPCTSSSSATTRTASQRRPARSCLFISFSVLGVVVFAFTTFVVASLDALVGLDGPSQQRSLQQGPGSPTLSLTSGPALVIVEEESNSPTTARTASPSLPSDAFADSLGAVAEELMSSEQPLLSTTAAPASEQAEEDEEGDALPEPPRPPAEEEAPVPLVRATGTTSAAKSVHACTYGKSEASGLLSMSTWTWRFKKSSLGHDEYMKSPGSARFARIRQAVRTALSEDWKHAGAAAVSAGYTLCRTDFGSHVVVAWQPRMRGDVLLFTRHGANVSQLVMEVPHPQFDHTLVQGLHVFEETRARALVLSTSHRCSKAMANKCTGNDGEPIKSNCAGRTSYHNSDAAHATQTSFMAAHEALAAANPRDLVVSLHSTKLDEFVVSDGTSNPAAHESVGTLARALASAIPDSQVGLCNSIEGLRPPNLVPVLEEASFVCGATNVQGRHLNGAEDPCRAKVSRSGRELVASGRFIHIEQPVQLVKPETPKSLKPPMSSPLSQAILAALSVRGSAAGGDD